MSDTVVELRPGTSDALRETERVDPIQVLQEATGAGLARVVVVGRTAIGELYIASSDSADLTLALLARATGCLSAPGDLGLFAEPEQPVG